MGSLANRRFGKKFVKPIVGGLLVAVVGLVEPGVYGAGYGTISRILRGDETLAGLALLLVLKVAATSFTLNFGGSGGLFIPSIFVGAALGALFGKLVGGPVELYAVAGMASVLAATQKTLLTAVAFAAETAGSSFITPILVSATFSYFASGLTSFYDLQLLRRPSGALEVLREAMRTIHSRNPGALSRLKALDVAEKPLVVIEETCTVKEAIELTRQELSQLTPVVDGGGRLIGFVTPAHLLEFTERSQNLPVAYAAVKHGLVFSPTDPLLKVIEKMLEEHEEEGAVIDPEGRLLGVVRARGVLRQLARLNAAGSSVLH